MRSGEIARRVGVSPDTIRHYEKLGLLKAPHRTASGYRDYAPEALVRVRLIRRALGVGFSLKELETVLQVRDHGGNPCHSVFAAAKSKLENVERQINDLKTTRSQLKRILHDWSRRLAHTRKGQAALLLESLPEKMEERSNATHTSAIHGNSGRSLHPRRSGPRAKSSRESA